MVTKSPVCTPNRFGAISLTPQSLFKLEFFMVSLCFILVLLVPSIAVAVYLNGFAIARTCGVKRQFIAPKQTTRFAILIPAHNEAQVIEPTLRSIRSIDYDPTYYKTFVIADNCNDNTAALVRSHGFPCLERTDNSKLGKGFALSWGFDQIEDEESDAVVVIDADCPVEPKLLKELDGYFQNGAEAVQSNHRVTNLDTNAISYVVGVGRVLEYELLYAPKSALGFPVMLVGTGMALSRQLLNRIPWTAEGCAEDTEYTLELTRQGVRVEFAIDAYVQCSGVTTKQELDVQRSRWAAGNLGLGRANALRLMFSGLLQRNWPLVDVGFALLIASRPLIFAHAAATITIGLVIYNVWPTPLNLWASRISLLLIPAYIIWGATGVFWVGVTRTRLRHLVQTPMVVARLGWIALRALAASPNSKWRRTPRA